MYKKKKFRNSNQEEGEKKLRVKLPRGREVIGLIDQRVGGSRMKVNCSDGKMRICKVPGRLRRKLWIREGDYVIVQPWEFDDTKGDILFKYTPTAINFLKKNNHLDGIEEGF